MRYRSGARPPCAEVSYHLERNPSLRSGLTRRSWDESVVRTSDLDTAKDRERTLLQRAGPGGCRKLHRQCEVQIEYCRYPILKASSARGLARPPALVRGDPNRKPTNRVGALTHLRISRARHDTPPGARSDHEAHAVVPTRTNPQAPCATGSGGPGPAIARTEGGRTRNVVFFEMRREAKRHRNGVAAGFTSPIHGHRSFGAAPASRSGLLSTDALGDTVIR